jgi:hypothetical protein
MGAKRNVYRLLVGKPEGKSKLGRPRRSWEDNIKVDVLEIVWGDVDWACSTNGAKRFAYMLLVVKAEGKRSLRRPRRGWVDNIKIGLLEIGLGGVDWACYNRFCFGHKLKIIK